MGGQAVIGLPAFNKQNINHQIMKLLLVSLLSTITTLFALLVFLLPLTYGIDPTGLGQTFGIGQNTKLIANTENLQPIIDPTGDIQEDRQQTFNLVIPARKSLDFKVYIERDYGLNYFWATDGKPLYAELRGEQPTSTDNKLKVFGQLTENKGKGFFIPPFTGNYSFFWTNNNDQAVTVRLSTKGVFKLLG